MGFLNLVGAIAAAVSVVSAAGLSARDSPYGPYGPVCSNQLKTPPPEQTVCEETGSVRRPSIITAVPLRNLTVCRDNCIANTSCLSFSYATNNRSCTLYSAGVLDSGFVRTPTGTVFANRRCYERLCDCPADSRVGTTLCGHVCTNTTFDSSNCGECGHVCSSPTTTCSESKCVCPDSLTVCNGQCVDTRSGEANCGACGVTCTGEGKTCYDGGCRDTFRIFASTGSEQDEFLASKAIDGLGGPGAPRVAILNLTGDRFYLRANGQLINISADKTGFCKSITQDGVYGSDMYFHGYYSDGFDYGNCVLNDAGDIVCKFKDHGRFFKSCVRDGSQTSVQVFRVSNPKPRCSDISSFSKRPLA